MDNKRLTGDEREVMRDLHRLGKVQPDHEAADRALQRAMVALERVPGDVRSAKGNGTSIMHPMHDWRWWFWRLIMPTSVMAAIIAISVTTWVGPTQQVSAAALLEQVIAAQKAYDGWIRVDINTSGNNKPKWERYALKNEALGRAVIEFGGSDFMPADIVYIDRVKGVHAKYGPPHLNTLFIGDYVPGLSRINEVPLDLEEMIASLQHTLINGNHYNESIEKTGGNQWLTFTKRSGVPAPDPASWPDDYTYPQKLRIEVDPASSRLLQIQIQKTEASPLRPLVRFTTQAEGIDGPEDLTLPPGAKTVDNRTTGELKELLDSVDGLLRDGIGAETVILIRQDASPYTAEMKPSGEITVMAHDGKRWASRSWRVGTTPITGDTPAPLPEGWPEPTLEAVLKAVEGLPRVPQTYWSDGHTAWYTDSNETGKYPLSPQAAWALFGPANQIWWGRRKLFKQDFSGNTASTSLELKRATTAPGIKAAPANKDGRMIVATTLNDTVAFGKNRTEVYYTSDALPVPYRVVESIFETDRLTVKQLTQWDFDLTDTKVFGKSVRVPLRWRRTTSYARRPVSTSYFHLIPCPDADVPEEWFAPPDESE